MHKRLLATVGAFAAAFGLVLPPAQASQQPVGHSQPAPQAVAPLRAVTPKLQPTKTVAVPGAQVTFTVQLPTKVSRPVTLQRRLDTGWNWAITGKSNRSGLVRFTFGANRYVGSMQYRVLVPAFRAKKIRYPKLVTSRATVQVNLPTLPAVTPGSATNPLLPGTAFNSANWTMTLGVTDQDGWPEIAATDASNVAPKAGWSYLVVPVTYVNSGTTAAVAWDTTRTVFQGNDGVLYTRVELGGACGVVPESVTLKPAVAPGGTLVAAECAVVRTAVIPGGRWLVRGAVSAPDVNVLPG